MFLAKDVFHVFSKDDILANWEWRGSRLDDETIGKLKSEAAAFQGSLLWKILKSEAQWRAVKTLVEEGRDEKDLAFTRQVGYVVHVIDEKLKDMTR